LAAGQGDLDTVQLLLDKGADVRVEDHFGHTPLALAEEQVALVQQQGRNKAVKDLTEVVKLLKERGAN
jgi:ankyrin repeat protein